MPLTLEQAQAVVAGAQAHARKLGITVAIAVVDEGGHLQALARMDGAPPLAPQIAESKAVGAAVWHRDGDSLATLHKERQAFFEQVDQIVRLPLLPGLGSVLVKRDGRVQGAVGVSGGAPAQDKECAEAGLASVP